MENRGEDLEKARSAKPPLSSCMASIPPLKSLLDGSVALIDFGVGDSSTFTAAGMLKRGSRNKGITPTYTYGSMRPV